MTDPTPILTISAALRDAGAALIQISGAARECHMRGSAVRQTYLREAHRAVSTALNAMHAYEMSQVDALRARSAKLAEPV